MSYPRGPSHPPEADRGKSKKSKRIGSRSGHLVFSHVCRNEIKGTRGNGGSDAPDEARRAENRCSLTLKCLSDSLLHVPL